MRKSMALGFAICSTLLLILLFLAGRMLYIKFYHQSYADITDKTTQTVVTLTENQTEVQTVTDPEQLAAITELLSGYTYTQYPHLLKPGKDQLMGNLLTVTFENGNSIGVNADGYVFVNGELRDIEGSRGQEFYHKLYLLFYPNAT